MSHPRTMDRKSALLVAFAAIGFALLLVPRASFAMTVTPPSLDFNLNPGDTLSEIVHVKNDEDKAFQITPEAVNFSNDPKNEDSGTPQFYPADQNKTGYELGGWIQLSGQSIVVEPGQLVNVPITVNVPKNATPGTHVGAVKLVTEKPGTKPNGAPLVSLQEGTAVLIFAHVSGKTTSELSVSNFSAQAPVLAHLPANMSFRLNNTGNLLQRPVGNIIVEDMFGRRVATLTVNPGPQYQSVLPNTARRFTTVWVNQQLRNDASEFEQEMRNFGFGRYTATLLLNYGTSDKMQDLTAVTQFWVMPWMAILLIAAIILAALLVLKRLFGGYNKMLIRRYEAKKRQ